MSIREIHHAPLTVAALLAAILLAALIVTVGVIGWLAVILALVQ